MKNVSMSEVWSNQIDSTLYINAFTVKSFDYSLPIDYFRALHLMTRSMRAGKYTVQACQADISFSIMFCSGFSYYRLS